MNTQARVAVKLSDCPGRCPHVEQALLCDS
jgi:hypothetical protein